MFFGDLAKSEIGREYDDFTHPPVTSEELIRHASSLHVQDLLYLHETAARRLRRGRVGRREAPPGRFEVDG